ncbi:hypothetical protein KO528_11365 [Saccharophagus degradans]|uniref:hypothetical protein n=1 Tax=Saccharophagus degradans TaxID=86304 RepID=UPI001C07F560|nr:hypothetical protein [Saccharophagus degradans]MBU2985953.1 hypothetical protein [Saccharophagus degradans]
MNDVKSYKIIGSAGQIAKFDVAISFLQVEFSDSFCKMRAPLHLVKVEKQSSLIMGEYYNVQYCSPKVDVFWELRISIEDGDELIGSISMANDRESLLRGQ